MLTNQIAILATLTILAAEDPRGPLEILGGHLIAAVVFSIVGIIVFFGGLYLMEKLTPFSIHKEIIEEHNMSMSIIIGAIVIGMSLIIAGAITG